MLTVTESNAVNTLLDWLLDLDAGYASGGPPTDEAAQAAAEVLAAAAHKRLMTGHTPDNIGRHWPRRAAPTGPTP